MSTNFTANLFATHDFYLGMMTPLSLDEIDLLLHQGYSRELVFYLVIDKAKITPYDPISGKAAGPPRFDYNRPGDPSFPEFQTFIQAAMEHGLTTELAPVGGVSASKAANDVTVQPVAGQGQTVVVVQNAEPPAKNGVPSRQTCYEQALASPDAMKDFALVHVNYCGSGEPPPAQQLVLLNGKAYKIEVVFRSTYGIFRYLGDLVNNPAGSPVLDDYSKDYPDSRPPEYTPSGIVVQSRHRTRLRRLLHGRTVRRHGLLRARQRRWRAHHARDLQHPDRAGRLKAIVGGHPSVFGDPDPVATGLKTRQSSRRR